MKYFLILLIPFMVACQERYRYPCQDPENWELKMCKKPYCTANGTCPEDLRHYEKENRNYSQKSNQNSCSGGCK